MKFMLANPWLPALLIPGLIVFSGCKKEDDNSNGGGNGVITETGSPSGSLVSGTFDASGGTLASQDGRVELVIPPGALAGAAVITLQPISNQIPQGIGNAYRLGPDGMEFMVPVKLILHYQNQELTGTVPELVFAAHQGADRIWQVHGGISVDANNKTITAALQHFSDWGFFASVFFQVSSEIVMEDEEVELAMRFIPGAGSFSTLGEDETVPVESPEGPDNDVAYEIDNTQPLPIEKGTVQGSGSSGTFTAPSSFQQTT